MRFAMRNLFCLVMVAAMFAGCGLAKMQREQNKGRKDHNPAEFGMSPPQHSKRHVKYAPNEPGRNKLELDVFWNDSKTPQPMVVYIHGGGWTMGSKDDEPNQLVAYYIANQGYVTFSVDYRLIPKYAVEDCIKDVFGAVVWAKEHAGEFGGDPNRVGAVGFSAGAHLAAMLAVAGDKKNIFPPTGHTDSKYDATVSAAVDFFGLYDFGTAPADIFPLPKWMNRTYYWFVFEGDPKKRAEYGRKISPITYISDNMPPQFVVCGDADSLKVYPQSVQYVEALKQAGGAVEFISIKGADHAFNFKYWTPEAQLAHKATIAHFDKYVKTR